MKWIALVGGVLAVSTLAMALGSVVNDVNALKEKTDCLEGRLGTLESYGFGFSQPDEPDKKGPTV